MDISINSNKNNQKFEDVNQKLDTLAYYIEYLDARIGFVGLINDNTIEELKAKLVATQAMLTDVVATPEQKEKVNSTLGKMEKDLETISALKAKQLEKNFNAEIDKIKERYGID